MMSPLTFTPLYMPRVWGGRALERVYGRRLPDDSTPFGEAWEIVDRENEQSVVNRGAFNGQSLHTLWNERRAALFGDCYGTWGDRFPILIKILDSSEDLSIQVHPPLEKAEALGGEPKTEMWVIADATPDAKLYVGLKAGISRDDFEQAIDQGTVEQCVHAVNPRAGESIFIPSGRLHAIGGGLLIHEIQQNSDTTYRVFDWNRMGLDGQPRELHVAQSLASIDFQDCEPAMDTPQGGLLAECPFFRTDRILLENDATLANPRADRFSIIGVIEGALRDHEGRVFTQGDYFLLPRGTNVLTASNKSTVLQVTLPPRA